MWLTKSFNADPANVWRSCVPAQFRAFEQDSVVWAPRVDVEETEEAIVVHADLPGIDKKDLKVNLENNRLTISGQRNVEKEEKNKNVYRSERAFGAFQRTFSIPDRVKADSIKADYKNGVLTVTLPKDEQAKPREININ